MHVGGRNSALKDQVNSMLSSTCNVSTRIMLKLSAIMLLLVGGVQIGLAANTGNPPQLIPFQMGLLAGNPYNFAGTGVPAIGGAAGGFGGEGLTGAAVTINTPQVITVDSVNNVYFVDSNAVIREINATTGVTQVVAGSAPVGCATGKAGNGLPITGQGCHIVTGCSDGVAAAGSPIQNAMQAIAVDAYGNLYFDDSTTNTISVIYRGGTQVANFIKLVNPAGVATAGGVLPGYVYHVAGTIALSNCQGTSSKSASSIAAAIPAGDGNLAYNSGATFANIGAISLDSAGNIYVADAGINQTIRVINTQSVAQTFFGITVQPGFIASIANCGALTQLCPPGAGQSPITTANTGIGGSPQGAVFNTLASGQGQYISADAYGNIYELNYKGATPGIYMGVAYAGGSVLGNLIDQANKLSSIVNAPSLKATAGDFYYLLQTLTLRPGSISQDAVGNLYYEDNHYGQVYRIDINSVAFAANFLSDELILQNAGAGNRGAVVSTPAAPAFCYGAGTGDAPSTTNPTLAPSPTTPDIYGTGCPAVMANGIGNPKGSSGFGTAISDGQGNLFIADKTSDLIRDVLLNNRFLTTTLGKPILVGQSVQQTIQVHFDGPTATAGSLPVTIAATQPPTLTTSSFSIAPGSDFSIDPIDTIFTTSSGSGTVISSNTIITTDLSGHTGLPVCANATGSADFSVDCVVNVDFSPTAGGVRTGQLVVTTANGSVYHFGLTGIGSGGQLSIDGGSPSIAAISGLGNPAQVAVSATGNVYVADPTNNRVVAYTPSTSGPGGTQTTVGTGLKSPMGVAVDTSDNVYISDTGNNRILKISQATGVQTVMGQVLAVGSPAYNQYTFKGPQGLAVDVNGNVYVADTGNGVVVEIPFNPVLGGATPLLQYPGAPAFVSPVSVAVDRNGNIYVADTSDFQIEVIPAGGGDLQNLPPSGAGATLNHWGLIPSPSGVAVDSAGNVYASGVDANGASQVYEIGSAPGASATQFQFAAPIGAAYNFAGTAPAATAFSGGALALDANGNLYMSDSGNSRILVSNRNSPTVDFGTLALYQPADTTVFTITNSGTVAVPVAATYASIVGDPAFTIVTVAPPPPGQVASPTLDCSTTSSLTPGGHCTVTVSYLPTVVGSQSALLSFNGTSQTVSLSGKSENPYATVVLAVTSPTGPLTQQSAGSPITVTATLTQPHIPGVTPTGTMTFTYSVNGVDSGTTTMPMVTPAGTSSTTSFTIPGPAVLEGRKYAVNASYQGDTNDSPTVATPLSLYVPGIPVTVLAPSATFVYGTNPPPLTGTVTGILNPAVTYTFTTAANAKTPIGTYPITVVFSGGDYLDYGFPQSVDSGGHPSVVVETAAALAVKANSYTALYGDQPISYTSVVTGNVNKDKFSEDYTPVDSSVLNVGTYPIVPTVKGIAAGNYKISVTNGLLTVNKAPTTITVSPAAGSVLTTALSTDPISISVTTAIGAGKGTPTGSVTISDTFTPIIAAAPGTGPTAAPVTIGPLTLVLGSVNYTPTSTTPGTHVYSVAYIGDSNFQCASQLGPSYTACPSASVVTTSVVVDNQDFTISSTTSPISIAPGTIPGGIATIAGEAAAFPEQATVTISSILSFKGTVTLSCVPQSPLYVTCTVTPPAVTIPAPASGSTTASVVSIASISTPATLPLNFNFGTAAVRQPLTKTVLAFLPLGALAFCLRRRRRLSKALWMMVAIGFISTGLSGCGGNSVHFFTPVPAGPQTVTIFATDGTVTRSFTVSINIQ